MVEKVRLIYLGTVRMDREGIHLDNLTSMTRLINLAIVTTSMTTIMKITMARTIAKARPPMTWMPIMTLTTLMTLMRMTRMIRTMLKRVEKAQVSTNPNPGIFPKLPCKRLKILERDAVLR